MGRIVWSDNTLTFILSAFIALAVISYWPGQTEVVKTVGYSVLTSGLGIWLLTGWFLGQRPGYRTGSTRFFIIGLGLIAALSALLSTASQAAFFGQFGEVGTAISLLLWLLLILITSQVPRGRQDQVLMAAVLLGAAGAAIGLADQWGIISLALASGTPFGSAATTAAVSGLLVIVGTALLVRRNTGDYQRILVAVAMVPLLITGLLFTGHVWFWVVFLSVCTVIGQASYRGTITWFAGGLGGALIILIGLSGVVFGYQTGENISPLPNPATDTVRLATAAWTAGPQELLIGPGPGLFADTWHQHRWSRLSRLDYASVEPTTMVSWVAQYSIQTGVLGTLLLGGLLSTVLIVLGSHAWRGDCLTIGVHVGSLIAIIWLLLASVEISVLVLSAVLIGFLLHHESATPRQPPTRLQQLTAIIGISCLVFVIYTSVAQSIAYHTYLKGLAAYEADSYREARTYTTDAIQVYEHSDYHRLVSLIQQASFSQLLTNSETDDEVEQAKMSAQEAVLAARRAIALEPQNYEGWFICGNTYYQLFVHGVTDALEDAAVCYNQAVALSKGNHLIVLAMAYTEYHRGNYDNIVRMTSSVLSIDPENTAARQLQTEIERP